MGVPSVALVDVVQMANLTSTDRIVTANPVSVGTNLVGAGRVVFDNSTSVKPDAGTNDTDRVFDSNTYDPDPLYVTSLHSVVEILPPVLSITNTGGGIRVTWPLLSLLELQTTTALNGAGTIWDPVTNADVGTNQITATLGLTNAGRYFRLHRPW